MRAALPNVDNLPPRGIGRAGILPG